MFFEFGCVFLIGCMCIRSSSWRDQKNDCTTFSWLSRAIKGTVQKQKKDVCPVIIHSLNLIVCNGGIWDNVSENRWDRWELLLVQNMMKEKAKEDMEGRPPAIWA